MKIHCHRPSLATAFQVVGGVVPTRTPKDILKNVKLQVVDAKATLIGTDQEVGIRYEIPGVEIESPGELLLPAARMISILRELQDDGVNLEVVDTSVLVRAGHSEFRLPLEDPAEFPPVVDFNETDYFVVPGSVLRRAIQRTVFATDVESTRYALGGVLLELNSEFITLVATDSRRLAVVKSSCRSEGSNQSETVNPVVPAKALSLVERSIPEDETDVFIAVHTNDIVVKSGLAIISSRLVEGRFPRYRDVIPKQTNVTLDLPVGPFCSAVRQAQIITNEESRGVDFKFTKGLLTLDSQAAEIGQSKVEMPVGYEGDDLSITFDPRFITEFLRILGPETQVKLELIDSESAAVFRTEDAYTYVIMPLSRDR